MKSPAFRVSLASFRFEMRDFQEVAPEINEIQVINQPELTLLTLPYCSGVRDR